jgi:four helix bundle protein
MQTSVRQQLIHESIQLVEVARPLVEAVGRRDRDLGQQLRRALSSVALNVAEGFGNGAGNARLRFQTAKGSLHEAEAGLRLAVAWGYLQREAISPVLHAADALGARLYGLAR